MNSFDSVQEEEFQKARRPLNEKCGLVGTWAAIFIWMIYVIRDELSYKIISEISSANYSLQLLALARVSVVSCLLLLVLYLHFFREKLNWNRGIFLIFLLLITGNSVAAMVHAHLQDRKESVTLVVLLFSVFLPLGLRFREALKSAIFYALFAYMIEYALSLTLDVPTRIEASSLNVAQAILIGSFGAYFRESAERSQFVMKKHLERSAITDPLTSLANRRAYSMKMESICNSNTDRGIFGVLILLDVDHFKKYNDLYGHLAGDIALKQVATAIKKACRRSTDFSARIGGEEFAVILLGIDEPGTVKFIEKLLTEVRDNRIPHEASETGFLSVSVGVAFFRKNDSNETIFNRADQLLYQAKSQGRDRACVEILSESIDLQDPVLMRVISEPFSNDPTI